VAAGILSFMMYASALESGSVTVATAAVILVETVPPAIVGVLLLGDTTRPGMTGLAIAGFVMALVSAVALARFGEASGHDQVERAAQAPSAARAMTGEAMTGHPHVGRPQAGQAEIGQAEIGQAEIGQAEAGTSNSGTSQGRVDDTGIGQTSQQTGAGQASQVLADRPALVAVVSVQVADGGS
jgi:hypothetical protein